MKRALIIGFGASGQAAASFLRRRGWEVTAVDRRPVGEGVLPETAPLAVRSFDLVVASPGVSPGHPLYRAAVADGVPVVGEAALALRACKNPCAAVTGTNGKTTVTLLTTHVLNACGRCAQALGNVGTPLTQAVDVLAPGDIVVAELSSFQLETMEGPLFDVGVILNITPDHLDRYPSMEVYAEAKWRLALCMKGGKRVYAQREAARAFRPPAPFCALEEGGEEVESLLPVRYRKGTKGDRENALAAWALCREFGVTPGRFIQGLQTFVKPSHRMEFVGVYRGVHYVDDSKGTNLDAVIQAVEGAEGPVVLIAGGVDKGASYAAWIGPFRNKVKQVIVLGEAADKIASDLSAAYAVERVDSLEAAVRRACAIACPGDTVLLSPGCASYDMFRDYAHRGEEFQRLVKEVNR
jgi:UDP-N-acetylmuramoylalanine--D-glutamate ligase